MPMSSAARIATPVPVGGDDWLLDEVCQLIEDLETFAFQAERVLTKLDLRAAGRARHIARQLRTIASCMELSGDAEMRDTASAKLVDLIIQGHLQLGLGEHTDVGECRPPSSSSTETVTAPTSYIRAVAVANDLPSIVTADDDSPFRGPTESEVPGEMRRTSDADALACQSAWTSLLAK